jgi:hypothetical protein
VYASDGLYCVESSINDILNNALDIIGDKLLKPVAQKHGMQLGIQECMLTAIARAERGPDCKKFSTSVNEAIEDNEEPKSSLMDPFSNDYT